VDYGSYTDASVRLMIELANSCGARPGSPDQLPDVQAVSEFLERHRMLGPNKASPRDVRELHKLRSGIRSVFRALENQGDEAAVTELNGLLASAHVTPWIHLLSGRRGEIFFAPQEAPLARRVTCDAGLGLAMMMTDHIDRLRTCAADDCETVFVDESRNRSRRYCSSRCSGRVNVAAFRSRNTGVA
jgi:predicted RNA-binding Zn ribbon-like protein